ncbi:hypothetical protein AUP68_14509 [Ilyonectria robusta]
MGRNGQTNMMDSVVSSDNKQAKRAPMTGIRISLMVWDVSCLREFSPAALLSCPCPGEIGFAIRGTISDPHVINNASENLPQLTISASPPGSKSSGRPWDLSQAGRSHLPKSPWLLLQPRRGQRLLLRQLTASIRLPYTFWLLTPDHVLHP